MTERQARIAMYTLRMLLRLAVWHFHHTRGRYQAPPAVMEQRANELGLEAESLIRTLEALEYGR